jgi:hypothetical protein
VWPGNQAAKECYYVMEQKGDATKGTGRVYFGDGSCGRFVWYYSITFGEHGEVLNFEAVEIGETGE